MSFIFTIFHIWLFVKVIKFHKKVKREENFGSIIRARIGLFGTIIFGVLSMIAAPLSAELSASQSIGAIILIPFIIGIEVLFFFAAYLGLSHYSLDEKHSGIRIGTLYFFVGATLIIWLLANLAELGFYYILSFPIFIYNLFYL